NDASGSTFTIRIPIKGERSNDVNDVVTPGLDFVSDRVLYVEDNPILRKLILSTLSDYNIRVVCSAEKALELLSKEDYGLFLIDINLGDGMNGIELAKIIRNNPRFTGCKIAAITAYSLDQIGQYLDEGVFNYYLSKPFDQIELLQ